MVRLSTAFDAVVLARLALPGGHLLLRLRLPLAQPACCAHFHISGIDFTLMRANASAGWVELYGHELDTTATNAWQAGVMLSGHYQTSPHPIPLADRPQLLLLGEGPGIATILHLASRLGGQSGWQPLVLLACNTSFPFQPRPSRFIVPGLPGDVIAAAPLLEDWGIPSRLCCSNWLPGCYEGNLGELLNAWLDANASGPLCQLITAVQDETHSRLTHTMLPIMPLHVPG